MRQFSLIVVNSNYTQNPKKRRRLQAVALNEGLRCKKRLWRAGGRQQLESFPLAPWASPKARRLMTHPGVGALTALGFVLILEEAERFQRGKQIAS